jgi:hypothetical protein
LTEILISKKFEKEIVFESSVLAWIRIRNRIRIEQKCWIRIRNKSIWIHNPGLFIVKKIRDPNKFIQDPGAKNTGSRIRNNGSGIDNNTE